MPGWARQRFSSSSHTGKNTSLLNPLAWPKRMVHVGDEADRLLLEEGNVLVKYARPFRVAPVVL